MKGSWATFDLGIDGFPTLRWEYVDLSYLFLYDVPVRNRQISLSLSGWYARKLDLVSLARLAG